jgi:hypothetical protein
VCRLPGAGFASSAPQLDAFCDDAADRGTSERTLSDWLWYMVLPLLTYSALLVAGILLPISVALALFVITAAMLLLLFIGIHNTWDVVTYTVF